MRGSAYRAALLRFVAATPLVVGLLAASSEAGAVEGASERISLDYAAPRDCPSSEQHLAQIASYTTRWTLAEPDEDARLFVVRIVRRDGSYVGRFDVRGAGRAATGREITADKCEDVALGLAIAVAIAIDPRAMLGPEPPSMEAPTPAGSPPAREATPSPGALEPPPPAKVAPAAENRAPPPARPAPIAASIGARGEASSTVSDLIAVLGLYVELEWSAPIERLPSLRPVLRAAIRQSLPRTNHVGPSEALIAWSAAELEACPTRVSPNAHLSIEGCLSANLGILSAQARGIWAAGTTRRLWLDYGAVVVARWQLHPNLFAEVLGGVWQPVTRDRLRIEPDGVVSQAPALGLSAGVGTGWRF